MKSVDPSKRVCLDGWQGHFMGRRSKRERACGESEPFSQHWRLVGNELILKYKAANSPPTAYWWAPGGRTAHPTQTFTIISSTGMLAESKIWHSKCAIKGCVILRKSSCCFSHCLHLRGLRGPSIAFEDVFSSIFSRNILHSFTLQLFSLCWFHEF